MKFKGGSILVNILAMLAIFVILCLGVNFAMDIYTHHGESMQIPDIKGMNIDKACGVVEDMDLELVVSDSGYYKNLPAGQILEQSPAKGQLVKSGHVVYVVVNSGTSMEIQIPDLIDNSSYREAEAELIALGFKVGDAQRVHGEKDWVYGIVCNGKNVYTGDYIPIDAYLKLQVGDGLLNEALDKVQIDNSMAEGEEEDDFEEIY